MMSKEFVKMFLACKTIDEFYTVLDLAFKDQDEVTLAKLPDEVQRHLAALYQRENEANGGIIGDPHDVFREKIK